MQLNCFISKSAKYYKNATLIQISASVFGMLNFALVLFNAHGWGALFSKENTL